MLILENLIIETTRKCNLRCAHCLRGNSQRLTMSPAILNSAMRDISNISMVTFTGGEPSLATEVIEQFIDNCIWRKVSFDSFYIVTNGKTRNGFRRFLKAVDRLYQFANDQDMCGLTVSRDQFHKAEFQVDMSKFDTPIINDNGMDTGKKYYGEHPPYFNPNIRSGEILEPIAEGRAIETGVGWRDPDMQKPWELSTYSDGDTYVRDEVYVAANGNVVSSCNMSFDRIDEESKGNVLQTPLSEIIESYSVKEEQEVVANG